MNNEDTLNKLSEILNTYKEEFTNLERLYIESNKIDDILFSLIRLNGCALFKIKDILNNIE